MRHEILGPISCIQHDSARTTNHFSGFHPYCQAFAFPKLLPKPLRGSFILPEASNRYLYHYALRPGLGELIALNLGFLPHLEAIQNEKRTLTHKDVDLCFVLL